MAFCCLPRRPDASAVLSHRVLPTLYILPPDRSLQPRLRFFCPAPLDRGRFSPFGTIIMSMRAFGKTTWSKSSKSRSLSAPHIHPDPQNNRHRQRCRAPPGLRPLDCGLRYSAFPGLRASPGRLVREQKKHLRESPCTKPPYLITWISFPAFCSSISCPSYIARAQEVPFSALPGKNLMEDS